MLREWQHRRRKVSRWQESEGGGTTLLLRTGILSLPRTKIAKFEAFLWETVRSLTHTYYYLLVCVLECGKRGEEIFPWIKSSSQSHAPGTPHGVNSQKLLCNDDDLLGKEGRKERGGGSNVRVVRILLFCGKNVVAQ